MSLAIARLKSRNQSKWVESVRKMSGQIAQKRGHHRRSAHFLARVVNLLNALDDQGSLEERCETALRWAESESTARVIQEQYQWSNADLALARVVITLAAGRKVSRRRLAPGQLQEAQSLAQILVYSESVLGFASERRRRACGSGVNERAGAGHSMADLKAEEDLYGCLPSTFRRRLEMLHWVA